MNNNEESNYHSYLLRLGRDNKNSPWRASLQSTTREQILQFADVGQMWAFLLTRIREEADTVERTSSNG